MLLRVAKSAGPAVCLNREVFMKSSFLFFISWRIQFLLFDRPLVRTPHSCSKPALEQNADPSRTLSYDLVLMCGRHRSCKTAMSPSATQSSSPERSTRGFKQYSIHEDACPISTEFITLHNSHSNTIYVWQGQSERSQPVSYISFQVPMI
jgi:hypothetical protein